MNWEKVFVEGIKLVALFGVVALIIWSMPEQRTAPVDEPNALGQISVSR